MVQLRQLLRADPLSHGIPVSPNSRRLRPGQLEAFKRQLLAVLEQELFGPGKAGQRLWQTGAVTRALNAGRLGAREAALLALIETPEAMEDYVMRARSRSDARRRAERCVAAVELVIQGSGY